MSDYILFPNSEYPDTSPEANSVGNYLASIALGTHPAIVAGEEAYKKALCDTGYFCCGEGSACDCEKQVPFFIAWGTWHQVAESKCMWGGASPPPYMGGAMDNEAGMYSYTGDPGCKPWGSRWCDGPPIPPCGIDPIAKVREDTLRAIEQTREETVGREARIALAGNSALTLSNERLSGIFYNSMLASAESILIGMANTFLQAGAIAGAIAGATQVFSATMGIYASQANTFLQSFEPYSPPPIGGGGGLS
jgi:hypothetical protein